MSSIDAATPDSATAPPAVQAGLGAALSLAGKTAALGLAVTASVLALVILIPETNTYSRISVLKHERLEHPPTANKIVLVGGSNLAFGVDSPILEKATGCTVVNMGMNGYLGVRFMMNEVEPDLHPGDVVVIAFEHDNFFTSVDGDPFSQFWVVKANPALFARMTWKQRYEMVRRIPQIAQEKILRLLESAYVGITGDETLDEGTLVDRQVELFSNFSAQGDMLDHIGFKWPNELGDQTVDFTNSSIRTDAIALMGDFAERLEARGVRVMMSFSPLARSYYDQHAGALEEVNALVAADRRLNAPSPLSAFVYDTNRFFDTIYHLNGDDRTERTEKLLNDLETAFDAPVSCARPADGA